MQPTGPDRDELIPLADAASPAPTADAGGYDPFELWQDIGGSD
jgi:hypothetical protein